MTLALKPQQVNDNANIDAEEAVLGTILTNNESLSLAIATGLTAEHFSLPIYQTIFRELARRIGLGQAAAPITIRDALPTLIVEGRSLGQLLAHLTARTVASETIATHAEVVIHLAVKRELIKSARQLAYANEKGVAPEEAIRIFYEQIDAARQGALSGNLAKTNFSYQEILTGALEQVDAICQDRTDAIIGFPTGIAALDTLLGGGLYPGHLVVCGARPGMGKTTLAVALARSMAAGGRCGVGFFSLEMSRNDLGFRYLTELAFTHSDPIAYTNLRRNKPKISVEYQQRLHDGVREHQHLPIDGDFSNSLSVNEIAAKARAMGARFSKHGLPLGVIVIDYLEYIRPSERYKGQKTQEVGEIVAALKQLARMLNICVVLMVQLNRGVESRDEKRPTLADLRNTGQIEAESDVVMFLYREHYYATRNATEQERATLATLADKLEVNIAKSRMGPPGTIELFCDMASSTIRDWETFRRIEPETRGEFL